VLRADVPIHVAAVGADDHPIAETEGGCPRHPTKVG